MAFTFHGIAVGLRDLGMTMNPQGAHYTLMGIETLSLRMKKHVENAGIIAKWLEQHSLVGMPLCMSLCIGLKHSNTHTLIHSYTHTLSEPSAAVLVSISNNKVDYTSEGISFYYQKTVVIDSVVPSVSFPVGGHVISIRGKSLHSYTDILIHSYTHTLV